MYCLSIQVLPEKVSTFDHKKFLQQLAGVSRTPEVDRFQERGQEFLHYNFFTEKPVAVWQELQAALLNPAADHWAKALLIACEPLDAPDDARLLHHPDPREKIDTLP